MTAQQRARLTMAALMLIGMSIVLQAVSRQEEVPPRESFAAFPRHLGEWTGRQAPDFDARVVELLGVDDYLSWTLTRGRDVAGLYVGYWRTQRQGDTMHSPLNCLPGSGWEPVSRGRVSFEVDDAGGVNRTVAVNRIVIQKGLDRQLVLYWYQSHNRVVASEYVGKLYTVLDSLRYNRSDAAIVRIVMPIVGESAEADQAAERAALDAARAVSRVLPRFLPT